MAKIEKSIERIYTSGGTAYKAIARYGFEYLQGNDAPHFHVVVDQWRKARNGRWLEDSFGCQHDLVSRRFPEIAPLVKWHLVSTVEPMHYVANGIYWWEMYTGEHKWYAKDGSSGPDALPRFKSTIVYGAVPSDALSFSLAPTVGRSAEVRSWLIERLPILMARFRAEVVSSGFDWEAVQELAA